MGDSLDLGRLADNLPSSNGRGARAMQAAEADLQSAFRNSALCITQMLKAGQKASKRSYQAGYSTALQDVLEYLQASLDVNVAQQRSNEGIAQVIDYIEARQEAVRVEMQDLEADEDQQQQAASTSQQHQQHASPQVHASTSSQYFRSHPHRQQEQAQAQAQAQSGSTPYRQLNQQQAYQPIASTSGSHNGLNNITNQNQSHQGPHGHQHQQHHRKQRRSLSPLVSRASATTASSIHVLPNNTRLPGSTSASALNGANLPYQHRQINDIEAERTQESIPLASSSSIPNSPEARFTPDHVQADDHHLLEGPTTSLSPQASGAESTLAPTTNSADASLSNASSTAAMSPLTRLQAKRERERERHHHHDRKGRNTHAHGRDLEQQGALLAQGNANATVAAGVKRRWTAALLPEHHTINLSMNIGNTDPDGNAQTAMEGEDDEEDDDDLNSNEETALDQGRKTALLDHGAPTTAVGDDDDSEMMEMDDSSYRIDGNARPNKRTARR